jgi:hypothetical protein
VRLNSVLGLEKVDQKPCVNHQAYGDNAMRRAAVFKWGKRFRDGETKAKDELFRG